MANKKIAFKKKKKKKKKKLSPQNMMMMMMHAPIHSHSCHTFTK
jgi:hypothetical protein